MCHPMLGKIPRQLVPSLFLAGLLAGLLAPGLFAASPQKQILDGLRAKGDFDGAINYLQQARTNPALPKSFAETIDYELAMTHIDAVRQASEADRDTHYQLAQDALKTFLVDHPRHVLATAARSQLASVLFDRGRWQRSLGEQHEGGERQKQMEAARELFRPGRCRVDDRG